MTRPTLARLTRAAAIPLIAYTLVVALLTALERPLVFPAPDLPQGWLTQKAAELGADEVHLASEDGTALYGWRLGTGDRLVLYFSGNGDTVAPAPRYQHINAAGAALLHVNYRGYPGSDGRASEAGLRMDARAAWAEARRTHAANDIVLMGKSLGGGVAMALAAERCATPDDQPRGVFLESTFTSIPDVAAGIYPWLPVRWVMRTRFDSLAAAPSVGCPVVVVHGAQDEMIPAAHGAKLAAALPNAEHLEVPGVHNELLLAQPGPSQALARLLR